MDQPPWDPERARLNLAKHGVPFEEARAALNHPLARRWPDTGHSEREERSIVMGFSPTGRPLLIVASHRSDGMMRIISARRATKREQHVYEDL